MYDGASSGKLSLHEIGEMVSGAASAADCVCAADLRSLAEILRTVRSDEHRLQLRASVGGLSTICMRRINCVASPRSLVYRPSRQALELSVGRKAADGGGSATAAVAAVLRARPAAAAAPRRPAAAAAAELVGGCSALALWRAQHWRRPGRAGRWP